MQQWLTAQLQSVAYDQVSCRECAEIMTGDDIKRYLNKSGIEKYEALEEAAARRKRVEEDPSWRWCLSPSCASGQRHDASTALFICEVCGAKACVRCQVSWHESETCEDRLSRFAAEEVASIQTMRATARGIPFCKKPVVRNGGCSDMFCASSFQVERCRMRPD